MKNLQITNDSSKEILLQKYSNRNLELDSEEFVWHIDEYNVKSRQMLTPVFASDRF
jgi:hypothetical protein